MIQIKPKITSLILPLVIVASMMPAAILTSYAEDSHDAWTAVGSAADL